MPAVINVGGPMVWGLVVLLSAWAVRAGRALAGRRRKRSSDDDDIIFNDPNAPQPRFLQRLSATAIRMLIETGALPCAVLEIADAGASSTISKHGPGGTSAGCGSAKPSVFNLPGGPSALPQPPARIVPPELAAAVPYLPAAACVRALAGPEVWRTELVHAATAAAGGSAAPNAALRASHASSFLVPASGREAPGGPGSTGSFQTWRGRLGLPLRPAPSPPSGGGSGGLACSAAGVAAAGSESRLGVDSGAGGSQGGVLAPPLPALASASPQQRPGDDSQDNPAPVAVTTATATATTTMEGNCDRETSGPSSGPNTNLPPVPRPPLLPPQQHQRLPPEPTPSAAAYTRGGVQDGSITAASSEPYNYAAERASGGRSIGGGSGLGTGTGSLIGSAPGSETTVTAAAAAADVGRSSGSGTAAAIAAAAATNMAALPYPPRHALLVVLGRDERTLSAVTAAAAAAGYSRVATWSGNHETFASTCLSGPRLPALSRNALWLILQLGQEPLFHVPATVLDVRRPDERLSYGAIRGTVNVPVDELAAALALPAPDFRQRYGVGQPAGVDVVVVMSRSGRRAAWAAQLCWDAGLRRVFIYEEGVCGWRLEDRVKPYRAYDVGALPPDPELFTLEEADEAAGFEELHKLGMSMRQGTRPSRFAVLPPSAAVGGTAAPCPGRLPPAVPPTTTAGHTATLTSPLRHTTSNRPSGGVPPHPNGGPVLAAAAVAAGGRLQLGGGGC